MCKLGVASLSGPIAICSSQDAKKRQSRKEEGSRELQSKYFIDGWKMNLWSISAHTVGML